MKQKLTEKEKLIRSTKNKIKQVEKLIAIEGKRREGEILTRSDLTFLGMPKQFLTQNQKQWNNR